MNEQEDNDPPLGMGLGQGLFLPLVLWLNELRGFGNYGAASGVFILLELLYMVDAIVFLCVLKGDK